MINTIFEDKIETLAYNRYLNEEQPNERDYNLYNGFKDGMNRAESLFINAFYKACDDLNIENHEQLLDNIKKYINR